MHLEFTDEQLACPHDRRRPRGLGRGFVELAVVLEELGRVAVVFVEAAR